MRLFVIALIFALLAGCTAPGSDMQGTEEPIHGQMSAAPEAQETAKEIVVLETNRGNIEIELDREASPTTVQNFLDYVNAGFYDNTIFHRVIPGFMIQGGGFDLQGVQKGTNAPIALESNNGLKNVAGAVAMARTNVPDSATSQFFINTVDNSFLDFTPNNPGYAVFGKVVSGMGVVAAIENVQTGYFGSYGDWPVEPVIIRKAYVKGA